MTFNPDITQISMLNYAKLGYEIGNPYENVPNVIIRYLESYPKSNNEEELTQLLLSSYTNSGDYDSVIDILTSQNDYKDDRLLQRVTFLKASQLFSAGNYLEAKSLFQKAVKNDKVNNISAQSLFWLAQTNYELNRFEEALEAYYEFEKKTLKRSMIHALEFITIRDTRILKWVIMNWPCGFQKNDGSSRAIPEEVKFEMATCEWGIPNSL